MANINVVSLGCPKNLVDTENMLGVLTRDGHGLVERLSDADIVLINTCGFIESAKREALDEIMRAIRAKARRPSLKIIVAGCFVQRYVETLKAEFPEVDGFLGVHDVDRISEIVSASLNDRRESAVSESASEVKSMPRMLTTGVTAYLKISEGCDNRCSYCAIPIIRGGMHSRSVSEVLAEARALSELGAREFVIVAQDPTRYGLDRRDGQSLPELIRQLSDIDGVNLIRLMYAHPDRMNVLREALTVSPKVCRYADVPVQHASRSVLRRMGRSKSGHEYLHAIADLRAAVPGISLRSTFMVGFPGETDSDFGELMEFVQRAKFEHAGVFKFSPEEGTVAAGLDGQVPPEVASERLSTLEQLVARVSREVHALRVGTTARFLVLGKSRSAESKLAKSEYSGRTEFQAPDIDGTSSLLWDGDLSVGDVVTCTINAYEAHNSITSGNPAK